MESLWSLKYLQDHLNCQNCAVEHFDITNNCTLERILFQVLWSAIQRARFFSFYAKKYRGGIKVSGRILTGEPRDIMLTKGRRIVDGGAE